MLHLFFPFLPSVPTNVCLCFLAFSFLIYIYITYEKLYLSLRIIDRPVFSGRTEEDMFSSSLYRFRLWDGVWEAVQPTGGKPPATAGHSMVYHAHSKTLLVYGGHRPTTARYTNTSLPLHRTLLCL